MRAAREQVEKALNDGSGWSRFRDLVAAQDGDLAYIDNPSLLPTGSIIEPIKSKHKGYLSMINARVVGKSAVLLGGGRRMKTDQIDHGVGIIVCHKVGDWVEKGEPIFTIYANDDQSLNTAKDHLASSLEWSDTKIDPLPHFYGVIE